MIKFKSQNVVKAIIELQFDKSGRKIERKTIHKD